MFITEFNCLGEGCYVDLRSAKQFIFDHVKQKASEIEEYKTLEEDPANLWEAIRSEIARKARIYVSDFYSGGRTEAFFHNDKLVLVIVSHKYNSDNFWNGRWRSVWTVDTNMGMMQGLVRVDAHYFEDGNVQLRFNKVVNIDLGVKINATDVFYFILQSR